MPGGGGAFTTGCVAVSRSLACCSGVVFGDVPVFGMMSQPYARERFSGDGGAAYYRGPVGKRDLHVRECASLEEALMSTTSPLLMNRQDRAAFSKLEDRVKLSRYGGDCYIYAMVAMGYVDIATDAGLKPYDIQALVPIIRGAGGVVTTLDGGDPSMGGFIVASGSEELHRSALASMTAGRDRGSNPA